MNRRALIRSVLLTTAACAGVTSGARVCAELADGQVTLTLYDPRFPKARELASLLAQRSTLRPIAGDVSELLSTLLPVNGGTPCNVAGVTTESVPFCLEQLLSFSHASSLEMKRLDADLFAWTLRSR